MSSEETDSLSYAGACCDVETDSKTFFSDGKLHKQMEFTIVGIWTNWDWPFLSLKDMSTNLKARHYTLFYLLLSFIPIGLDFYYIALAIGKTLDLLTDIFSVLRGNLVSFL